MCTSELLILPELDDTQTEVQWDGRTCTDYARHKVPGNIHNNNNTLFHSVCACTTEVILQGVSSLNPWMWVVSQGARSCLVLGCFHSLSFWYLPAETKRLPHYGDFARYLCILLMTCTANKINHVNLVFHCCRNILQIEPANSKKCTCLHTLSYMLTDKQWKPCYPRLNMFFMHLLKMSKGFSTTPMHSRASKHGIPRQYMSVWLHHIAFNGVAPMCQTLGFPEPEEAQKET